MLHTTIPCHKLTKPCLIPKPPTEKVLRPQAFWAQRSRRLSKVNLVYYVYLSLLNLSCIIASSTLILLDGKTPGQYNGSLLNGRIKQKIVHSVKGRYAPARNGIPGLSPTGNTSVRNLEYKLNPDFRGLGAYHLYLEERDKP